MTCQDLLNRANKTYLIDDWSNSRQLAKAHFTDRVYCPANQVS